VEVAKNGFRLREIPERVEEIYSVRSREIQTAKESLKEGNTIRQLAESLRCRPLEEKSELWISGKIRELLGKPELLAERRIDQHDLDEQAWLVTGGPKRLRVAQNGGPMSERHSGRTGLKCLLRQRRE